MSERVFAVGRVEAYPDGIPHGFSVATMPEFDRLERLGAFFAREPVESDPSLKQLIPYAVVVREDSVFLFRRTNGGGEKRLHGLRSIGVGGHVNPVDLGGGRPGLLSRALRRELDEELTLPGVRHAHFAGILNDDSTAVGSVHLGAVAVVEPFRGGVEVNEHDTMTGGFVSKDELLALHCAERDSFESWSALLIDRLDEVLAWPRPEDLSIPILNETPTSTI